ncbi:hypothetical protein DSM92_23175 [Salmonella enterica subsp. enterica]|nr:hypothetical protein [Salmonella enterica subsp. enterica serovar Oranienburg]
MRTFFVPVELTPSLISDWLADHNDCRVSVSFLANLRSFHRYLLSYHHLRNPRHHWFFWRFFPTIHPTILHFGRIFWSVFFLRTI